MSNAAQTESVATETNEPQLGFEEGDFQQSFGQRNYYVPKSDCPSWCDDAHLVSRFAEQDDRHIGSAFFVPVRSLGHEYLPVDKMFASRDVCVDLGQPVLYRYPEIRVSTAGEDGFTLRLSVREAGLLAEALQSLVTEANQ